MARIKHAPNSKSSDQLKASFEAFAKIEQSLSVASPLAFGLPSPSELCRQYKEIKKYIKTALKFVDWLPNGETICKVIEILMELADQYCQSQSQALSVGPDQYPFSDLERVLSGKGTDVQALGGIGSVACQKYHQIKKYIEPMLEVVEWLPYGSTIVKIVRLLMRLADAVC